MQVKCGLAYYPTKMACPRMSVGYAEVLPFRGYYPTKMGQASAYRTTLLGRWDEWGQREETRELPSLKNHLIDSSSGSTV